MELPSVLIIECISNGWILFSDLPNLAGTHKLVRNLLLDDSLWPVIASKMGLNKRKRDDDVEQLHQLAERCRDHMMWTITISDYKFFGTEKDGRTVEIQTQDRLKFDVAMLLLHTQLSSVDISFRGEKVKYNRDEFYVTPRVGYFWCNAGDIRLQATGLISQGKSCLTIINKGNASGIFVGHVKDHERVIDLIRQWPHKSYEGTSLFWASYQGERCLFTRSTYGLDWNTCQLFKDGQFRYVYNLTFTFV